MPYMYRNGLPLCSRSGVYTITNVVNGKVYVGSALLIRGRMHCHRSLLRRGNHDNEYLQRAWDKYGEALFEFTVLESCTPDKMVEREQYWIDYLQTTDRSKGYNICLFAGAGAMTGRKHSPESRAKMSANRKGMSPAKASEAAAKVNKGKPRSAEVRAKISASNKGKKKSPEHVAKMKANHWTKRMTKLEVSKLMRETGRKGLDAQGKNGILDATGQ